MGQKNIITVGKPIIINPAIFINDWHVLDNTLIDDKLKTLSKLLKKDELYSLKTVVIDFSQLAKKNSHDFNLKKPAQKNFSTQRKNICIRGYISLWQLSQKENIELSTLFKKMRNVGILAVDSSQFEQENMLTNTEIINIHTAAHKNSLPTIASVEIIPSMSKNISTWKSFQNRVHAFAKVLKNSEKILSLSIHSNMYDNIQDIDLNKAFSLARLLCPNIDIVSLNIDSLYKTIRENQDFDYENHIDKIFNISIKSGVNNFGFVEANPNFFN